MSDNHRFTLYRNWMGGGGLVNFVMLNPSTADDTFDDPTIRKCIGFAKRWGFSRLSVTNLFAFRATDPSDLKEMARVDYRRAIGKGNDGHLITEAKRGTAVCAWGNHGTLYGRDRDVIDRVLPDVQLCCIGLTGSGNPLHPCRAPYTAAPLVFVSRMSASPPPEAADAMLEARAISYKNGEIGDSAENSGKGETAVRG